MGEHPSAQNGGYVPIRHWANRYEVCASNIISSCHVETVVLLSQHKADDYVHVDLNMEELDRTPSETKASYTQIKEYIQKKYGVNVKSLYIAQVKRKCGIIERESYNFPKTEENRVPQCPPEKEKIIMEALRYFQMIE